jgi:hypothetical protein
MPRNSSGVYTLPSGNPVTAGTTIDATWANTTLSDIANEVTNSLDRNGNGGMLAAFRFSDGSLTAPGMSWLNETNSGFYRLGAGEQWAVIQGSAIFQMTINGVTVPTGKTLTVIGNATVGGTLTATGGVIGNATNVTGTVAVANGGTGATAAAAARTNLGATTVGGNVFTLTNPSAITFPRFNADNTVSALDAATFRTAIGAGSGGGSVTSVAMTVPAFLSVTGSPVTTTGTLAVTLSATPLPIANGGTAAGSAAGALTSLGAAANGANNDITALNNSSLTVVSTATINSSVIGYRDIPQNAQSSTYSFAAGDAGKHIYSANTGAQTITVPTGASIIVGTAIMVVNNGTTAITFTTTGCTVYKGGTSVAWASGGTLGVRGMATFLKVATDTWFVSGAGLS